MQVASAIVIIYLFIGRKLRAWMPLFVYANVVTGKPLLAQISDVLLTVACPKFSSWSLCHHTAI